MIEVKNLRKSFGDLEVIKGVDLNINKGDVISIIGPSGSGKTTLLRCMNFLEKADAGVMTFNEKTYDMSRMHRQDILAIRKKTAFVFQNYNLFFNKTALENVTEGLIVGRGVSKAKALDIGRALLKRVGLEDRQDYYPSELSGGQQQRVAIARAVVTDCKLLLADEPTGNLDSVNGIEVMELLSELNAQGTTIIIVTHSQRDAMYAHRVIQLLDGQIVAENVNRPLGKNMSAKNETV